MTNNTYSESQNEKIGENSFMKKLLKKRLNQKGLTLIELLAVIVILAIVAAIAIPAIGNVIQNSRVKAAKNDAIVLLESGRLFEADNGTVTTGSTVTGAQLEDYAETDGGFTMTSVTLTKTADGFELDGNWTNGSNNWTFTDATIDNLTPVTSTVEAPMTVTE